MSQPISKSSNWDFLKTNSVLREVVQQDKHSALGIPELKKINFAVANYVVADDTKILREENKKFTELFETQKTITALTLKNDNSLCLSLENGDISEINILSKESKTIISTHKLVKDLVIHNDKYVINDGNNISVWNAHESIPYKELFADDKQAVHKMTIVHDYCCFTDQSQLYIANLNTFNIVHQEKFSSEITALSSHKSRLSVGLENGKVMRFNIAKSAELYKLDLLEFTSNGRNISQINVFKDVLIIDHTPYFNFSDLKVYELDGTHINDVKVIGIKRESGFFITSDSILTNTNFGPVRYCLEATF